GRSLSPEATRTGHIQWWFHDRADPAGRAPCRGFRFLAERHWLCELWLQSIRWRENHRCRRDKRILPMQEHGPERNADTRRPSWGSADSTRAGAQFLYWPGRHRDADP